MNGRKIATVVDQYLLAGKHRFKWKAQDANKSGGIKTGIYIYRLKTPFYNQTNKMYYIKQY